MKLPITPLPFLLLATLATTAHGEQELESNRPPLRAQPYFRLPMGSVHAKTWLKHQLDLQRDGLTGAAEDLYGDIGGSDWITDEKRGGQHAWERGPYYARGLIALAYVLDDDPLKARSEKWIERILASQRDNGDFGPKNDNWWANMIVLYYMRDHLEATGDKRILPFIEKYLRYQLGRLPEKTLGDQPPDATEEWLWPKARGGDNLEIVLWLYKRTGDKWLLELANLLIKQTNQWSEYYADGSGDNWYPDHVVNTMQGFKTPPLQYLVTGREIDRKGFFNGTNPDGWLMQKYGRADGMLSGSEPLTSRGSTEGTELCAIAERIYSNAVAMNILGEAVIGDQLERVAYNALPAALLEDGRGIRYYILPNQPKCTNEFLRFKNNGAGKFAICPGPAPGYPCCRSNFHFAWPTFVHNMWMATADGGLAVSAYGPNAVTARVGSDRTLVTIEQATDYPFRDASTLTIRTRSAVEFPLELRIPEWCGNPTVSVNGTTEANVKTGSFYRLSRMWRDGDKISVELPMEIKLVEEENASVALTRGPLLYSLLIHEDRKPVRDHHGFTTYEIRPTNAWNYALMLDEFMPEVLETIVSDTIPRQPFRAVDTPLRLRVRGAKTTEGGWGTYLDHTPGRAASPPKSPVQSYGDVEDLMLVPYGSTEIRISYFPWFRKN